MSSLNNNIHLFQAEKMLISQILSLQPSEQLIQLKNQSMKMKEMNKTSVILLKRNI